MHCAQLHSSFPIALPAIALLPIALLPIAQSQLYEDTFRHFRATQESLAELHFFNAKMEGGEYLRRGGES